MALYKRKESRVILRKDPDWLFTKVGDQNVERKLNVRIVELTACRPSFLVGLSSINPQASAFAKSAPFLF